MGLSHSSRKREILIRQKKPTFKCLKLKVFTLKEQAETGPRSPGALASFCFLNRALDSCQGYLTTHSAAPETRLHFLSVFSFVLSARWRPWQKPKEFNVLAVQQAGCNRASLGARLISQVSGEILDTVMSIKVFSVPRLSFQS